MLTYKPRPYQLECIKALAEARANGVKRGLVHMASGLGKTLTAAFDIEQFLQDYPNARVLILCHRETILTQTKRKFKEYFGEAYSYGMYTGSEKTLRPTDFFFATFQTMKDHREEFAPDTFAYVVVDEAHHTPAATYRPTVDYFQAQFLLGLTATKDRMDGQDILEIYEQVIYSMDIYDGWCQNYLARAEYRLMLNDLNEAEFKKYLDPQESSPKVSITQLNKTIFSAQTDADIANSIREQISDLDNPTVFIFCNGIAQAESMASQFAGEAAMIHSGQSPEQNQLILDEFYAGKIRIILSVDMLNEGIDIPTADVVVFLRATESQIIFFQQLGRGARITEGKRTMRVLDYVANIERIMMVLEMEETAQKRLVQTQSSGSTSAPKLPPIEVNIPKVKFAVRKVDIEKLLISISRGKDWTNEELAALLCRKAEAQGGRVRSIDLRHDASMPPLDVYLEHFGTWNNALQEAGLKINLKRGISKTEAELITLLQQKAMQLGRTPTATDVNKDPKMPHSSSYNKQFGKWSSAIAAAGLEPIRPYVYTKAELLKCLRRKMEQLGRSPSQREMLKDPSMPSIGAYEREFGSWKMALAEVGGKLTQENYSDEQLIAMLQDATQRLGRNPRVGEFKELGLPSRSTFEKHFGTWKNALVVAGLKVIRVRLGRDELLNALLKKAEQLGHTPGRREVDEDKAMPSSRQYVREFGSWRNCIDAAGLDASRARRRTPPNFH